MKAEIITIGDELLLGQTVDTNSAWMGGKLHEIGIEVYQVSSVSDDRDHILSALQLAIDRCDLVLITGGLGPTKDDITKHTLCDFFETDLVLNQIMFDEIKAFFDSHDLPMIESNRQQAFLPRNCQPIINEVGTAAGMLFEKEGKIIISMPGVPHEMKKMMSDSILPKVKSFFKTQELVYDMIYTQGIGESFLVEKIKDWEDSLESDNISIAYLPERGNVKIRLSSSGDNRKTLIDKIEVKKAELKKLVGNYIITEEELDPFVAVGKLLKDRGETVSTAESCTGGSLAAGIVSIPGSSSYFIGGVVSYHTNVKIIELGVRSEDIEKHTVVSETVANEMSKGVLKKMKTDWAISTTGIAGPDGGTENNPVGTVWIAVTEKNGSTIAKRFNFEGNRSEVIAKTTKSAILQLRNRILLKEV